jgi:plasmid stabilization system protein ParE
MNVEFHPAALREAEDAQAWYEERSVLAASAFLRELSVAIQRVRQARTGIR